MAREPEHIVQRRRALGQALAARRQDKGLTQEHVARATYCHRSSVGHIEQGDDPRADEAFWKRADDLLEANGELLGGYKALEIAKCEHEVKLQEQQLTELRTKAESLRAETAGLSVPASRPLQAEPAQDTDGTLEVPDEVAALLAVNLALCAATSGKDVKALHGKDANEQLRNFMRRVVALVKRRGLLQLLGLTATTTATSPILGNLQALAGLNPDEQERMMGAIAVPKRVDAQVIDHIETCLWLANQQDAKLGPQSALAMVLAQHNLMQIILPECPESLQSRLLTVFGSASLMAGWLSFDSHDFTTAKDYYEQARTMAHKAQNTDLAAFVLGVMSQLATWTNKPHSGIDYALAAQTWAAKKNNPQLQAVIADRAARAYAADGYYDQCMQELDRITMCLDAPSSQPLHIPGYYNPQSQGYRYWGRGSATCKSRCMLQLENPKQAAIAANVALASTSSVRDTAFCTLYLANSHIQVKEIEEAATLIGDVAELATQNRSSRLMTELRTTWKAMQPWEDARAVRELAERMSGYGLVGDR